MRCTSAVILALYLRAAHFRRLYYKGCGKSHGRLRVDDIDMSHDRTVRFISLDTNLGLNVDTPLSTQGNLVVEVLLQLNCFCHLRAKHFSRKDTNHRHVKDIFDLIDIGVHASMLFQISTCRTLRYSDPPAVSALFDSNTLDPILIRPNMRKKSHYFNPKPSLSYTARQSINSNFDREE